MDNTNKFNSDQPSNNSKNNSNEKSKEKKPFLITQDVIDDCLSTCID